MIDRDPCSVAAKLDCAAFTDKDAISAVTYAEGTQGSAAGSFTIAEGASTERAIGAVAEILGCLRPDVVTSNGRTVGFFFDE